MDDDRQSGGEEDLLQQVAAILSGPPPFDLEDTVSPIADPYCITKPLRKARWARILPGDLRDLTGETHHIDDAVGVIVAEEHGRVVMLTTFGFVGWLRPERYESILIVDPGEVEWLN